MNPKGKQLLEMLSGSTKEGYRKALMSGMFWVYFPWATGKYEEDMEKAKRILEETQ